MRLNFSGVGEDEIREGIRRIGEVVREQLEMYGTLTGARSAAPRSGRDGGARPGRGSGSAEGRAHSGEAPVRPDELAQILRLPAQRKRAG